MAWNKSDRSCTSVHRLPRFSYTLAPYSVSDCRRGKINPFNVNMNTPLIHMHCPHCIKHYLQFPFCNIAHTCNQSHRLPIITRRYSSLQLSRFSFYISDQDGYGLPSCDTVQSGRMLPWHFSGLHGITVQKTVNFFVFLFAATHSE